MDLHSLEGNEALLLDATSMLDKNYELLLYSKAGSDWVGTIGEFRAKLDPGETYEEQDEPPQHAGHSPRVTLTTRYSFFGESRS